MKKLVFSAILLMVPLVSTQAMPVMEAEIHQKQCNRHGFFYDHDNRECTDFQLISCQQAQLEQILAETADGIARLQEISTDLTKGGFEISQCISPGKNQLTLGYVKKGLWLMTKTVSIK